MIGAAVSIGGFPCVRALFLASAIAWLSLAAPGAADVSVSGRLSAVEIPSYRVSRFPIQVDGLEADAAVVVLPGTLPGGVEISLEASEVAAQGGGRVRYVQSVLYSPVTPGIYELPTIGVEVDGVSVARLTPGTLTVSAPTTEEVAALEVFEPLYTVSELRGDGSGIWSFLAFLFALALALVVAALLYRFVGKHLSGSRNRPLDPLAEAMAALGEVENTVRAGDGACAAVYTDLSLILRVYLDRTFDLHVCELSTPEISADVLPGLPITKEAAGRLGAFLREADGVKFAQEEPSLAAQLSAVQEARSLVEILARAVSAEVAVRGAA